MKFVVDAPLGGLAKWLRFCGFDAAQRQLSPAGLATMPEAASDTYLLTGQETLGRLGRSDILVLKAAEPLDQLQQVLQRLKISRRHLAFLSRCSRCNEPLQTLPREQALGRVPDHIFHRHREFYECPHCRRLFWPGSHLADLTARLERVTRLSRRRPGRRASSPEGVSHELELRTDRR